MNTALPNFEQELAGFKPRFESKFTDKTTVHQRPLKVTREHTFVLKNIYLKYNLDISLSEEM